MRRKREASNHRTRLFVPDLPGVPEPLRNVALITIFAPKEAWAEDPDEPTLGCVIRTNASLEGLVPCDYVSRAWKTCILPPEAVSNDMPRGCSDGGDDEMWDKILELEERESFEYDEDVCDAMYDSFNIGECPTDSAK